jgi:fumarate reductase flavoprotein subunit
MSVILDPAAAFPEHAPVLVIGAGACGVIAALAARGAGLDVLMVERDDTPSGSTALTSGLVPAAGTRWQAARDIEDSASLFAVDIQSKSMNRADPTLVRAYAEASAWALEWLAERHGLQFELIEGFRLPGHSVPRMHGVSACNGAALLARLHEAARDADAGLLPSARVDALVVDESRRVRGVQAVRPGGAVQSIGCDVLVLASGGFGANARLVAQHISELREAEYVGHAGSNGDALTWGQALGAAAADLSGYEAHGAAVMPQHVLLTWALLAHGAVHVNERGARFANEHAGYCETALRVLEQPGHAAYVVYDGRLHEMGQQYPDYRNLARGGAVKRGDSIAVLAARLGVDRAGLERTLAHVNALAFDDASDDFGRQFHSDEMLLAPLYGVRVTGALLHTQGGLAVNAECRVLSRRGTGFPNLFAAGGAARGVSGDRGWGYLSGNGLLSAVAGGYIAGRAAAASCSG